MFNEDEKMAEQAELLRAIKQRYGAKKIRLVLRYFRSGLPKKFWFPKNKVNVTKMDEAYSVNQDNWIFAVADSSIKTIEYTAEAARRLVQRRKNVKYISFYDMIFSLKDKRARADLFVSLKENDVVVIGDVVHSKIYADEHSNFIALLSSLWNHCRCVVIGITIKGKPTDAKIEKLYGDLFSFYQRSTVIEI